jgi:uncharacterized protein (TIGR03000 family)
VHSLIKHLAVSAIVISVFCLPRGVAAQYYTYSNGYYYSYPSGYTFSPVSYPLAQHPATFTTPYGTPLRNYLPSINYAAFYTPSYNFLYNPAVTMPVQTYPPSVNYPAFSNPAYFATAPATSLAYSAQTAAPLSTAAETTYFPTGAYSTQTATIVPFMSNALVARQVNAYGAEANWLDSHPLASAKSHSGENEVAIPSPEKPETPVSRSDRATAYIDLQVPESAEMWFQGVKTRQTGGLRKFESPPLPSGQAFAYEIRVRWTANGREMTRQHRLTVRRGDWWRVNLDTADNRFMSARLQTSQER